MRESKRQADIRLALAERGDNVFWRNQNGEATYYKGGKTCPGCGKPTLGARKFVVPYGLCPGSSDLIGLVQIEPSFIPFTFAAFVGLEVKALKGVERKNQIKYRNLVNNRDGVVEVVRNAAEANAAIDRIRRLEPWTSR
jgi:hypothetical protein